MHRALLFLLLSVSLSLAGTQPAYAITAICQTADGKEAGNSVVTGVSGESVNFLLGGGDMTSDMLVTVSIDDGSRQQSGTPPVDFPLFVAVDYLTQPLQQIFAGHFHLETGKRFTVLKTAKYSIDLQLTASDPAKK